MSDYNPPRGDILAAPDPPPYPREWGPAQRLQGYWCAILLRHFPRHSSGWYGIVSQAQQLREQRQAELALYEEPDT